MVLIKISKDNKRTYSSRCFWVRIPAYYGWDRDMPAEVVAKELDGETVKEA
ncbi:MAG: hypothetical protein Q9202_006349 [Teloschistes flavicans]